MVTKPIIHLVATQCWPQDEEEFNAWYNRIHIPLLLKFRGIRKATRFKIINETEEYPKYLTIYEFENREAYEAYKNSPELTAAMDDFKETWEEKGLETKWRVQYELMNIWDNSRGELND